MRAARARIIGFFGVMGPCQHKWRNMLITSFVCMTNFSLVYQLAFVIACVVSLLRILLFCIFSMLVVVRGNSHGPLSESHCLI